MQITSYLGLVQGKTSSWETYMKIGYILILGEWAVVLTTTWPTSCSDHFNDN